jgi:hypothetical protein
VLIFLRDRRDCLVPVVMQRFVDFSAHPQTMQQDRQLACGGDDGPFLPALPAALGQLQTPAAQVAVGAKRSQNMLRALHQQGSQIGIAFLTDVHLRFALFRVSSSGL